MSYLPTLIGSLLGSGISNAAGGLGNAAMQGMDAQSEVFQVGMYAEQLRHQEQMQVMSQSFDEMMDEKSEQFIAQVASQRPAWALSESPAV